ncbi:hypothetical protein [Pseudomonas citri]|uniref:hypothetical protein n=1 Tax=Pseudomonas citri TaxID=2978349 RepID=UPI0021B65DA0|nr:hypothetical protein [Pseudomonas citri]
MKTQLIFTLALSALTAQAFAADGFDRTGSAAAIHRQDVAASTPLATDRHDHADPTAVASDGSDHTRSASTD